MADAGTIVGMTSVRPGEEISAALDCFETATAAPIVGSSRVPERVRVASPALAQALRERFGQTIEVRLAPTPEFDTVAEQLRTHLHSRKSDKPPSYLGGDINVSRMTAFFQAAANLYRAAPWSVVPSDTDLLALTIPALGVREIVVCVIGQLGQSFGMLLFADLPAFKRHLAAIETVPPGSRPPRMARVLALNFDSIGDVHPALIEEIAAHHWEIADPRAYPSVVLVEDDLVARRPTSRELLVMEAAALAVSRATRERRAMIRTFDRGVPLELAYMVDTYDGTTKVAIRAPYPGWTG
jgi:hypothetical protein